MVADVLVVPGDLRLDIVKLLIECTGLLGLAFGPVGFDVPQSEGHFFLTTETGLGSIDGDTAIIGVFPFFTDCLFSKHLAIHGLR